MAEPELQKEFEQIEHTPAEHNRKHGRQVKKLHEEVKQKEELLEEDEYRHKDDEKEDEKEEEE
jgi:hypothetical protein